MVIARGFGDFLSRTIVPKVKKSYAKKKDKYSCDELQTKIRLGERIVLYIRWIHGDVFADRLLAGDDLSMPHKFWHRFINNELEFTYNTRQRLRCYRALQYYVDGWRQGKRTSLAMLDGVQRRSKRQKGSMGFCFQISKLGPHVSQPHTQIRFEIQELDLRMF